MSSTLSHTGVPALLRRTRVDREAAELTLSPAATRSLESRGRPRREPPDRDRTAFEVDRDRIVHSKAFRRLRRKAQVIVEPAGDHLATRGDHALQVSQVARALAAGLGLNEVLAEAIALGHDVGHTPFGHAGEAALAGWVDGWHHAAHGVRRLQVLEGRNLTWEVTDGIRAHSWSVTPPPATPEAVCVRYADRIAYLTHDARDAVRGGVLAAADFPSEVRAALGPPHRRWVGVLVDAVLAASAIAGEVTIDPLTGTVMAELRAFLFARVYEPQAGDGAAARTVVDRLVDDAVRRPETVPPSAPEQDVGPLTRAIDYVAGMTDRYALDRYEQLTGRRVF